MKNGVWEKPTVTATEIKKLREVLDIMHPLVKFDDVFEGVMESGCEAIVEVIDALAPSPDTPVE
jgi:hypothetical protein